MCNLTVISGNLKLAQNKLYDPVTRTVARSKDIFWLPVSANPHVVLNFIFNGRLIECFWLNSILQYLKSLLSPLMQIPSTTDVFGDLISINSDFSRMGRCGLSDMTTYLFLLPHSSNPIDCGCTLMKQKYSIL